MKISTLGRHFREGARSVFRNGWMSFASASSIAISLFILGVFLLLGMNLSDWTKEVENQVEIHVYLSLDATDAQITTLHTEIGKLEEVRIVRFVPKEEGLLMMREWLGEDAAEILEGFEDDNPLPDSFIIEVNEPRQIGVAAEKIEALNNNFELPLIDKIDYGKNTVEILFRVTEIIEKVILLLVLGLAITSMFLISNTIKLTIVARRREIGIMKLVGATNGFIRWPFFVEGAILGLVGALIPVIVIWFGYWELVKNSQLTLGVLMIRMIPAQEIMPKLSLVLLGIGLMIGIFGSTLSVRKFLRV